MSQTWTKESRNKASESAKKRWAKMSLDKKNKILDKTRAGWAGKKHTEESRRKIREARAKQNQVFDDKAKKNMSEAQKRYWASLSPEEHKRKVDIYRNAPKNMTENTSIEREVKRQLIELGVKFEQSKPVYSKRLVRMFYFDFYLPEYKLIVECNGDYWHNLPRRIKRDNDLQWTVDQSNNRNIVWLWEHEINVNKNLVKETLDKYNIV